MRSRRSLERACLEEYQRSYVEARKTYQARNGQEPTVNDLKAIKKDLEIQKRDSIDRLWDGWNRRWKSHVVDKLRNEDGKAISKESGFWKESR
jgi:hypothetical protein